MAQGPGDPPPTEPAGPSRSQAGIDLDKIYRYKNYETEANDNWSLNNYLTREEILSDIRKLQERHQATPKVLPGRIQERPEVAVVRCYYCDHGFTHDEDRDMHETTLCPLNPDIED